MTATPWAPYDALLLVSFGGPEKPEDVVPFLQNVTAGKNIPVERLEEVGEHYYGFGGKSPINDQNRALIAALEQDLAANGVDLPVYWGNRNWDLYLTDTLRQMAADGVTRVACWVTSAYSSYSGCRQYRENFADAVAELAAEGVQAPQLDRLRHYFNHPGFVVANLDATADALRTLEDEVGAEKASAARLVFVTHSIPDAMEDASGASAAEGLPGGAYTRQHRDLAATIVAGIAERTGTTHDHDLVFCSRSGPPQVPWLEPDVNDHLTALAGEGVPAVVLIPIGFVSDHMEVIYDLDTEAAATAEGLGLPFVRAATAGTHPAFVQVARELLLERAAAERGESPVRPAVGDLPPSWDVCPPGCCANLRGPRPALCGRD